MSRKTLSNHKAARVMQSTARSTCEKETTAVHSCPFALWRCFAIVVPRRAQRCKKGHEITGADYKSALPTGSIDLRFDSPMRRWSRRWQNVLENDEKRVANGSCHG